MFYLSTKLLTCSRIYTWTSRRWAILNLSSNLVYIPSLPTGSRASKYRSRSSLSRSFLSDTNQPICICLFDRNRCHLWQYLVRRIWHVRGLCHIKHPSYRFISLRMLSSGVCGLSSNGKTRCTLLCPSPQSHPICSVLYFYFCAANLETT